MRRLSQVGLQVPNVLLPRSVDLAQWSVIASGCYSCQPSYWNSVYEKVQDSPSTLHLVYPHIFYKQDSSPLARVRKIISTSEQYMQNVLSTNVHGLVLLERHLAKGGVRKGLMVNVDLEHFGVTEGQCRATEGTFQDPQSPWVQLRKKSALEVPHVMMLINDPDEKVIEPLFKKRNELNMLYSTELMQQAGHIMGYEVSSREHIQNLTSALIDIQNKQMQNSGNPILYAVGDGNHSINTAKYVWEQIKPRLSPTDRLCHPARFALVELINVYDNSIEFNPIHRILLNVNEADFLAKLQKFYPSSTYIQYNSYQEMISETERIRKTSLDHVLPLVSPNSFGIIKIDTYEKDLEYDTLERFLDHYLSKTNETQLDFIFDESELRDLARKDQNLGIVMPALRKEQFFESIATSPLPKKSFSMGETDDKKFYMECRRIHY